MFSESNFVAKKLTSENESAVIDFITVHYSQNFFKPAYEVNDSDEYNTIRARGLLKQNWSVGIFEKSTNKLVGLMLNTIRKKALGNEELKVETKQFELSQKVLELDRFFEVLENRIFGLLSEDNLFYLGMATVHIDYRNHGIFAMVIGACYALAKESGCKYIYATPTTSFLVHMMEKHRWTVVKEVIYSDYDARNGTNLFGDPKYPFTRIQLAYKEIKTIFKDSAWSATKFQ